MKSSAALIIFLLGNLSVARPLRDVKFAGDGCPKESTDVVMTEDGETLSVLFEKFKAEVGGTTGQNTLRLKCDIEIPIDVPKGMGIAVYKLDYRGYHFLPKQGKALLGVEYDFGPHRSPKYHRLFDGEKKGEFTVTDTIGPAALKWLGCKGETTTLSMRAFITVDTNRQNEQAVFALDSADGVKKTGGLHYRIRLKKCD